MKIRPDVKLLENINFDILSEHAINARARKYSGPKRIKYGMSVNGPDMWANIGDCHYSDTENIVILDHMLQIFHKNIINLNAFDKISLPLADAHEWVQTNIYTSRKIPLNVIGINLELVKYHTFSGHLNMK
jgi:hypothetical protein